MVGPPAGGYLDHAHEDRTQTPVRSPSEEILRYEAACGRLRSLPTREQGLRTRAERAEAEVKRQERRALDAEEKYRWMVEHAAAQRLDGYRELGSRAASAENERDVAIAECERLRAAHPADIGGLAQLLARVEKADAEVERLRNGVGWLVFERTVQTRCGCPQCTMSVGAVADDDCALKKLLTCGVEGA